MFILSIAEVLNSFCLSTATIRLKTQQRNTVQHCALSCRIFQNRYLSAHIYISQNKRQSTFRITKLTHQTALSACAITIIVNTMTTRQALLITVSGIVLTGDCSTGEVGDNVKANIHWRTNKRDLSMVSGVVRDSRTNLTEWSSDGLPCLLTMVLAANPFWR